ncbi:Hypothetical protein CINCED_3A022054, partial [Cinara cedri]
MFLTINNFLRGFVYFSSAESPNDETLKKNMWLRKSLIRIAVRNSRPPTNLYTIYEVDESGHEEVVETSSQATNVSASNLKTDPYGNGKSTIKPSKTDPYGNGKSTIKPLKTDPYGNGKSTIKPLKTDPYGNGKSTIKPLKTDPYGNGKSTIKP